MERDLILDRSMWLSYSTLISALESGGLLRLLLFCIKPIPSYARSGINLALIITATSLNHQLCVGTVSLSSLFSAFFLTSATATLFPRKNYNLLSCASVAPIETPDTASIVQESYTWWVVRGCRT